LKGVKGQPSVSWLIINCLFVGARRREKKGQKKLKNGEEGRGD
jgi:hypothetical protein